MKLFGLILLLPPLLWGDIFLLDAGRSVKLAPLSTPKFDETTLTALPHVTRQDATITLLFEGDDYNHRHLNARLATLQEHPVYTVLPEYSEQIAPGRHRITFADYRFTEALMLQVYYCGEWQAIVLDALEEQRGE